METIVAKFNLPFKKVDPFWVMPDASWENRLFSKETDIDFVLVDDDGVAGAEFAYDGIFLSIFKPNLEGD